MVFLKQWCLTVGLFGLLAACETAVPTKQFPDLRYTHLPAISLAVSRVEVVEQYQSSTVKPHVEAEFPVLPARAASQWVKDRLSAVGGTDIVRATVTKASVVEVPLKRSSGVRGAFTKDQSERYDATLAVKIEILGSRGQAARNRFVGGHSVTDGFRRCVAGGSRTDLVSHDRSNDE